VLDNGTTGALFTGCVEAMSIEDMKFLEIPSEIGRKTAPGADSRQSKVREQPDRPPICGGLPAKSGGFTGDGFEVK